MSRMDPNLVKQIDRALADFNKKNPHARELADLTRRLAASEKKVADLEKYIRGLGGQVDQLHKEDKEIRKDLNNHIYMIFKVVNEIDKKVDQMARR